MIRLDKIRSMTDEELRNYLKGLTEKKDNKCCKCGANGNFAIFIKNIKEYQQKKLCCLCNKCYEELLDYLEIDDIIWG